MNDQLGSSEREHDVTRIPHEVADLYFVSRDATRTRVLLG